jgi:amino acid adenylation domain-containing protein
MSTRDEGVDIAIIGMSGRFPGAPDTSSLWQRVRSGQSAIRRVTDEEIARYGLDPALPADPSFVPFAAPLDGMEDFDADFFGYSPREAELMDPQQRLMLEACWEVLEEAGIDPGRPPGPVGVFLGATHSTYLLLNLASHPELLRGPEGLGLFVANATDSLAARVAYELDLRGPAISVQSACSTSLLAVHLACQSLLSLECDVALAGGVSVNLAQRAGYRYVPGSILSPDGTCRPFDAQARGTVFGSGLGVVVLKRLQDALADGDTVRAIVRGSAANNDGSRKAGFTAPSVEGQAAVVAEALAVSGVPPETLDYVEAHGTGTSLGDPIEVEALGRALRSSPCTMGSLKGLVGHLDVAAGIAGLCKVVLALEHGELPPSAGFSTPNPRLPPGSVLVNAEPRPWPRQGTARRAGVSAFGIGGTNVHVVLEEAPAREASHHPRTAQLLVLSARSESALQEVSARLARHLRAHPELSLGDVAFTLATGRRPLRHRKFVVARTLQEAADALLGGPQSASAELERAGAAFLAGAPVGSELFAGARPRRVRLPTYPFERRPYWIAPRTDPTPTRAPRTLHPRPAGPAPAAPRTELERQLVEVWQELLGLAPVGIQDSFFWLGGDSLLATRLAAELRDRWQVEVPLDELLSEPTVAAMAARVASGRAPALARFPPSSSQRRLLFLEEMNPGSSLGHLSAVVRAVGALDPELLGRALGEVLSRHAALRTGFVQQDGQWWQVVHASVPDPALPPLDLRGCAQPEAELRLAQQRVTEAPFDLARPPLVRLQILRWSDSEHRLILALHHLVADGLSIGVILRELGTSYAALAQHLPSPLPPVQTQFADFVAWQEQWLSGERLERQLAYWRDRLAGAPPLDLPADRSRPRFQPIEGAMWSFEVPPALRRQADTFARSHDATLYMTLLAVFLGWLRRYSAETDLTVGTPIANRHRREHADVVGYLANTLALRIDLSGRCTLHEAVERVRREVLAAQPHQDLPLERLVEEIAPERDPSRSPLFQVLFALLEEPLSQMQLPGVTFERLPPEQAVARFDLSLWCSAEPDRLRCTFEYATALFDRSTVQRMGGQLLRLLEAALAEPDRPLVALPMLPEEELALLHSHSGGARAPALETVPELISAQARRTPQSTAIVLADGRALTYAELDSRSDALAAALQEQGVGLEDRVLLLVERDLALHVGLLGIWKAGGAYVPLDPDQPRDRLLRIVTESGARVMVAPRALLGLIPCSGPVVVLGESRPATFPSRARADALAYVLFTSGSSGRPKGVAVQHASVAAHLRTLHELPGVSEADRVLALAAVGWDMSVPELYLPLTCGGTVVLAPRAVAADPDALHAVIRQRGVTLVQATPSTWRMLADHPAMGSLAVRAWTGAEAIPAELARTLFERLGCVWNLYGPTETTVWSTAQRMDRDHPEVGLGHPLPGESVHVLDADGQPVPLGVPGELYIGGTGVARGYHGHADLTAERFVPDPFGPPGARLYRTGDLARRRADGRLEYLGRADQQVKVRGYRVELGEIEAALRALPEVHECVVLQRQGSLVAYYAAEAQLSVVELRASLGKALPDYMIPAAFSWMAALPRNANGKLDRKALPEVQPDRDTLGSELLSPRTEMERALAELWAELLGLPRVGIEDDFFLLGGHSLLATQLVSRVRQGLGVELPLRTLFEAPTVAELARRLGGAPEAALPIPAGPAGEPAPLSFPQQRLWFLEKLQPGEATYHIPGGVRLRGLLRREDLRRALQTVIDRHGALRTAIEGEADGAMQRVREVCPLELPLDDLSWMSPRARQQQLAKLAAQQSSQPFDLSAPPLLRARLIVLGTEEHVLLITVHHLVADGWSVGVLIREVAAAYAGLPLPALPVQYADYARWQRSPACLVQHEEQLAWWKTRLQGAPVLELPTDRARPPVQSTAGAALSVPLEPALVGEVESFARSLSTTPFAVWLAGFLILLHRYSRQSDLSVGTTTAYRTRGEIEPLIGFFVNTLVLRADLGGAPSLPQLVRRVKETLLEAFAHQDAPFDRVVEAVQPARDQSRSPLFQVLFTQDPAVRTPPVTGLQLEPFEPARQTSRFDLSVFLSDRDGARIATFEYATALFELSTIERMAEHYVTVLHEALRAPELPIGALPLLSAEERAGLLSLGRGPALLPPAETLVQRFRAQGAQTPSAVALVVGEAEYTYAQLDRDSDRIARGLVARGAAPGRFVGLRLARGPGLVPAVLGVLKSGAAYVPLDPSYPEERLRFMEQDAHPVVVLTDGDLAELDGPSLGVEPAPRDLAYLIYTSGSTGRPKAVAIEHHNAVARIAWATSVFSAEELGGMLASTSLSFDLSVFELFAPLLSGGTVILAKDALALPTLPARARVRLVNTVPSAATELARLGAIPSGVTVNLAGEALPGPLVQQLYAQGARRVFNLYGPSEDTTYSTGLQLPREVPPTPPIGRPLPGTAAYVVDERGELVPRGVVGELWLGGVGLSRGYLGRPALTAERYVPDPWGGGARLYRTGDHVRWDSDGQLMFLGRADHQVKLRGFRIELGEIEAALREHPSVQGAVVVVREERLVAYLASPQVPEVELRAIVARRVPEYMVPSTFVQLSALPLTPNGKVDRSALPQPPRPAAWKLPPRTPAEHKLAAIWAEVFGLDEVGVEDDFFALGGHSLLAVRVVSRIQRDLGVELPLRALFDTPTVAGLASALVGAWKPAPAPVVHEGAIGAPLSYAQQRLWFLDQLQPMDPTYNVPAAVRLQGELDHERLRAAIEGVIHRHETLRTTFRKVDGEPRVVVGPKERFELPLIEAIEAEIEARTEREAGEPFDLQRGPVIRGKLLVLGPTDHLLMLTIHHIASDGWSMGVLVREVVALYVRPGSLPELPLQYTQYAQQQREELAARPQDLAWWARTLAGVPPLELPLDRSRPAVRSGAGAIHLSQLDPALMEAVHTLARQTGTTPFMILLAAFAVLLSQYSGRTDLCIGTPTANRNRPEIEGLIGFFVNTVVLRFDLSGAPSFRELLGRVRETTLEAFARQEVPFEQVVEVIAPQRDRSRSPLFQVTFTLDVLKPELHFGGLQGKPYTPPRHTAKFELSLAVDREGEASFEYATDLFEASTIERMAERYQALLSVMVQGPERPIEGLSLGLQPDKLVCHGPVAPLAGHPTLLDRFEAVLARRRDAVAVIAGQQRWTFGALAVRAEQIARHLVASGVRPEDRVGLLAERGFELISAMLGVIWAGAAYLPLDPRHPAERIAAILQHSQARLVLLEGSLREQLPALELPALELESLGSPDLLVLPRPRPEQLVYCLYTSGSTGRPKGVLVTHGGLVNYVDWAIERYGVQPDTISPLHSSIAFDLTITSLWVPLLAGAAVRAVPDGEGVEPLARALREQPACGVIKLTPAHLVALEARLSLQERARLCGAMVVGGEALHAEQVEPFLQAPGLRIYNEYGPTETVVGCSLHQAGPDDRGALPIGTPLTNTRMYVLDSSLRPVLPGVRGELYVGGLGVARGYLDEPGLTAERFVPDPFGPPGVRMYRTGDQAVLRPDGSLEFHGRLDHQVKLRGFRIELGEIEAALLEHPSVQAAVVILREEHLVAYLASPQVSEADLRALLASRVPDYMVPSTFVQLPSLPLTPNGKVDRSALPAPPRPRAGEQAPRTPAEQQLAAIWAEVLGLEQLGVEDNFFALGGHSLLAIRVISRIQRDLGVELPLRALFDAPTVRGLAAMLPGPASSDRIEPGAAPTVSFAQQRLWFLANLDPDDPTYNLDMAVRLTGRLEIETMRRALEAVIHRHDALRTVFPADGVAEVQPPARFVLECVDHSRLPREQREALCREEAIREAHLPFDLARGPLLRARLLVMGPTDHVLLLNMHHIVSDGWSLGVLTRELAQLYSAFVSGRPLELPPLPIQYSDFARWQRARLRGELLQAEIDWWVGHLAGVQPLSLPTDRPRPPLQTTAGASHELQLEPALVNALDKLALALGATPYLVMLAGLKVLLHKVTGQTDLAVGAPLANRSRVETEGVVGLFVNTLVLRTDLSGEPSLAEVVRRVRETAVAVWSHQDLPFERVVEAVQPARDLSRSPLFQVMFDLNAPSEPAEFLGLSVGLLPTPRHTAKFDLSVGVSPGRDRLHFEYNTDLFDLDTIEWLGRAYRQVLGALVAEPDRALGAVDVLTEPERHLVRVANRTEATFEQSTLAERFVRQAERTPQAPALTLGAETWTYARLARASRSLAAHLRALGVGPEVRVGVCATRSFEMVVALLAVLQAGGAYVPLDPEHPAERLAWVRSDADLALTLAQRAHAERVAGPVVWLEGLESLPDPEVSPVSAHALQLAYVIYTSGSTGRPKGVMITHQGICNRLSAMQAAHALDETDVVLQKTTFAFDVSVLEIFWPLTVGARLVLANPGDHQDPSRIAELIERYRVTTVDFVPSMLSAFLATVRPGQCRWLRRVTCGGEALSAELRDRFLDRLPWAVLHNLYGPTECAVDAAEWTCPAADRREVVPIGRPVANMRLYVLDKQMQLVPPRVAGELYVGGVGVARGYLSRPALTAERFVPDPFGVGSVLYRTGDLARWLPDGSVEFLGRLDQQVKLRGVRIELGEIETALRGLHGVEDAVAGVRDGVLVAWVAGRGLDGKPLQFALAGQLPGYLVPRRFVVLPSLPLGPTGKVDRAALPDPELQPASAYVAPSTQAEEVLATIWREVLGLERVGVYDDFFELGGHSLLLPEVTLRLRERLGVQVPIRTLLQEPQIATLALSVEEALLDQLERGEI